jgi:hypothetical protein
MAGVNAFFDVFDQKLSVYSLENSLEDDGKILKDILDGPHHIRDVATKRGVFNTAIGAPDKEGWLNVVVVANHEEDLKEVIRTLFWWNAEFA